MIQINLLPEELRKKKANFAEMFSKYKKYQALALPVAGAVCVLVVFVALIIIVYPKIQKHKLNKLEAKWKTLEKQYDEVAKLKKEIKRLQDISDSVNKIASERIQWAKRLNEISDSLPGEIQLIQLETKIEKLKDKVERPVLVISGVGPSYPGEKAIGDFIKGLRENKDFIKSFPDIEPPSTITTPEGLKKFTIKCYMTPEPKEQPKKKKETGSSASKGKEKDESEIK
jgi:Tfp pilus assembly protein PilN